MTGEPRGSIPGLPSCRPARRFDVAGVSRRFKPLERWLRGARAAAPAAAKAALSEVSAGSLCALVGLSYMLGYAVMIFGGDLRRFLPLGMPALFVSSFVVGSIAALRSPLPFAIAGPDANSTAILAVTVGGIAASVRAAGGADEVVLFTVLFTLSAMSVITGVVAYGVGALRRGTLIQVIPHSVIAGFIAGTGFLVVSGAFEIATGRRLDLSAVEAVRQTHPITLVIAVTVAAVLLGAGKLRSHLLGLPAVIVAGTAGFYALTSVVGLSGAQLLDLGMVPGPVMLKTLTALPAMPFGAIAWSAIASHAVELASVILIALMAILLNTTGIDVATGREVDPNAELRATGWANLASGLLGGTMGYLTLSRTLLNFRAGARTRFAGLWAAGLGLALVIAFPRATGFMPKPVLVGLLLFLGVSMLMDNAVRSRRRLPPHEHALVLLILGVIVARGFLAGVGLGVIGACVLFAWNYGRVTCIKNVFTGGSQRSRVHRPIREEEILAERGQSVFGLRLQGYLFFGTARSIVDCVVDALKAARRRFLVVDMSGVHGVDASALVSFEKLRQSCGPGTALVFSGLREDTRDRLKRNGILDASCRTFADLDHAMEWIEGRILEEGGLERAGTGLGKMLAPHFRPENLECLLFMLQPVDLVPGQVVFRRGEPGDSLLFIESGQLGIRTGANTGASVRLASYGPGTMVGESVLFASGIRAADVIADAPSRVFRLTADKLRELERTSPAAGLELKTLVIRSLAARLSAASKEIDALGG